MNEWRRYSRLPQSLEYWTALHARVVRAADASRVVRSRDDRWLDGALVAGVLAVAAIVVLLLTQTPPRPAATALQDSLAPSDPIAIELLNSSQPPRIGGLLRRYSPPNVP
jgi:hypothetical protein